MSKKLNAEKRFTKVSKKSNEAVVQFQSTIDTLEDSNVELTSLFNEVEEEISRLISIQESTTIRINSNNTTIQGLKNVILGN